MLKVGQSVKYHHSQDGTDTWSIGVVTRSTDSTGIFHVVWTDSKFSLIENPAFERTMFDMYDLAEYGGPIEILD
tara:strand:- start:60 stop:281 length:222 start_codon:yes stop_codon:yes gene_type:complete